MKPVLKGRPQNPMMSAPRSNADKRGPEHHGQHMRRAGGFLSAFLGLGFGLPCVFGIRHFDQTGQVWTFIAFPAYGDGPFEQIGLPTSTALLVGFLLVCMAEVALAVLLWTDAPHAAAVSYTLLPFELVFWVGFALPFGPLLGTVRTMLVFSAYGSDRQSRERQDEPRPKQARLP
jgi:hypothetical protein